MSLDVHYALPKAFFHSCTYILNEHKCGWLWLHSTHAHKTRWATHGKKSIFVKFGWIKRQWCVWPLNNNRNHEWGIQYIYTVHKISVLFTFLVHGLLVLTAHTVHVRSCSDMTKFVCIPTLTLAATGMQQAWIGLIHHIKAVTANVNITSVLTVAALHYNSI